MLLARSGHGSRNFSRQPAARHGRRSATMRAEDASSPLSATRLRNASGWEARLKTLAARAAMTTLLVFLSTAPARAQFNSIAPPVAKLTGGYLWGSLGYRDVRHPERFYLGDHHPFMRGGFAALFGPFGGQPDTTVTLDSVRTSVEWVQGTASTPGATRVDTVRTVHAVRIHHTLPGRDGWVSLAVGYQYAGAYHVDVRD